MRTRHPLQPLFLAALLPAALLAAEPAASLAPMPSRVFAWPDLAVQATKNGERREIFDSATRTLSRLESHVTTIRPGLAPHAPHRHADEELIIVREGTLEVTINGVAQTAGPGSMFFFASNDLHGMKNVGDVNATYYVIRIYPHDLPAAPKS